MTVRPLSKALQDADDVLLLSDEEFARVLFGTRLDVRTFSNAVHIPLEPSATDLQLRKAQQLANRLELLLKAAVMASEDEQLSLNADDLKQARDTELQITCLPDEHGAYVVTLRRP